MTTISGLSSNAMIQAQMLARLQQQLNDLSLQLSTGKQAQSYAGLGIDRGLDVKVPGPPSRLASYEAAITTVGTRVQLQNTALDRLGTISQDMRSATIQPIDFTLVANGQTNAQIQAGYNLGEALSLLNQKA